VFDHVIFSCSVHALKNQEQRIAILGVQKLLPLLEAFEALLPVFGNSVAVFVRTRIVGFVPLERAMIAAPHAVAIDIHDREATAAPVEAPPRVL
jgi:hypothetical protein